MTPEEFIKLYEKYIAGFCNAEEEKQLLHYKDSFKIREESQDEGVDARESDGEIKNRVYQQILQSLSEQPIIPSKPVRLWWWTAAAVVLLSLSIGLVLFNQHAGPFEERNKTALSDPIQPGADKAVLILADGSSIQLNDAKAGVLSTAGNTLIKKSASGELIYESPTKATGTAAPSMNTVSIPRGGKYQVQLPDGTRVWLNSETSLTYPVSFSGAERIVELKGEAYFEVAENKKMPFKVKTARVNVTVLGTHFNVMAYAAKAEVKTTLLEGAVKLMDKNENAVMLKPGEQGTADEKGIRIAEVKALEVVAWKSGYFVFRENTIQDIMQQIERWYDVDVEYQGKINNHLFGGVYAMNEALPQLLKALELTGLVHFKIEGRRIIVMS